MDGAAVLGLWTAVAAHGDESIEKIGRRLGQRQRTPAHLIRGGAGSVELSGQKCLRVGTEGPMAGGGTYAVQPGAPVGMSRRCECRARELLGIQAVGTALRRVLRRQRAGKSLTGKVVAETAQVLERSRTRGLRCTARAEQTCARRSAHGLADPSLSDKTPRRTWSSSSDSNSALKLPSPKPSLPLRWMISKKHGPTTFCVKICSSSPCPWVGAPSIKIRRSRSRARSSPCAPTR